MPAQKERPPPSDRGDAEETSTDTAESGEAGAQAVQLTHAEQEALRRRLSEKFH